MVVDVVIYECGDLRVDPANRRLTRGGTEVPVEPKAFAVLLVLIARAGHLVTRDELLDAVWGHRHSTPATLNRAVALLRRAVDDDADRPRFIHTVHGSGYRFIAAVERVAVPRADLAAHFGPPSTFKLPAKLQPLIGRDRELGKLCAMLSEHRAVTVIGPGGIGKTQCALEVGRRCAEQFPDGVWFFDLSPRETAQDWLKALAASLSVPNAGTHLASRVAAALTGRKALLLIDNCDRLAREVGSILVELLRNCPDLKSLTTSQQALDFVGEHLMWLPPLELPPPSAEAQRIPLKKVASTPSVALLIARACAVQQSFSLDQANAGDVVEICRGLDGIPLALELAAARFAMLSPAAIRERLRERFVLASDSAGREPRHRTMQALVKWSYDLLCGEEQRLLCCLAAFLQGWTLDGAEAFARTLNLNASEVLEVHSGLIQKSLVVVDPTLSPPRYRLLEPVREIALQLLRARGGEAEARRVHLDYFVRLAELSHREILASRAEEWIARLSREHANIEAALAWAKSDGADHDAALRLAGSLMLYGKSHGLLWLLSDWAERALEGVSPEPSKTYLRALLCAGLFKLYVQDRAIEPRLNEAVALAARLHDRWAQGCASAYLAMWDANQGQCERAKLQAAVAADIAGAEKDDWLLSLAGLAKGWIALGAGRDDDALAALGQLRGLSFDLHQHQMIDIYLGLSHYRLGHWRAAAGLLLNVVEMSLRTRNLRASAAAIEIAAFLAMRTAQFDTCARFLGKAAEIRERTRAPLFTFWIAHDEEATSLARHELGPGQFDASYSAGATARDELVIDEARRLLRDLADDHGSRLPSGRVVPANNPSGS
jgi:predicted ATPase/DNA-binding winged helix-turn-helix (wHTH) protein